MDYEQRYKKLRQLIARLNKERKTQAKKIDILCNDLIEAQRDFIKRLSIIGFTAGFYESIIGTTDLNTLLYTVGNLIKEQVQDANIAFFLRQQESYELHLFQNERPITLERQQLESYFTSELVQDICKANKLCTLDCLFAMGLQGNLNVLNKISAATLPLGQLGSSLGFILIYRSSENILTDDELQTITAITPGLSQAIASCQTHCRLPD